jgi:hypothetical protein
VPSPLTLSGWLTGPIVLATVVFGQQPLGPDPFAFFHPVVSLNEREHAGLAAGEAVVKFLPRGDREMAVFAAVPIDVPGAQLVGWVREIAELKESEHVTGIGRFSAPPVIEDLADLELDDEDLEAIRRCRPGSCGVKLSDVEIWWLTNLAAARGSDWKPAIQDAFRHLVLARVKSYLATGYQKSFPYYDQKVPVSMAEEFTHLLDQSGFLTTRLPRFAQYLRGFPEAPGQGIESFVYWSKETLGGKPMVIVTHVFIVQGDAPDVPEVLVASRQVYANHYMTGALALTAITGGRGGSQSYLTYLNRSRIDVLGGLFGGVTRLVIERRLRGEAAEVVQGLRTRLQTAPPSG